MHNTHSQTDRSLSRLLTSYFDALNRSGLLYAVMRNYEGLPTTKTGNDIDILISPRDAKAHVRLLREVAAAQDWFIIQVLWRPYICVVKLAHHPCDSSDWPEILHIDFFRMGSWYGTPFMSVHEVLSRRVSFGEANIFVLNEIDEIFNLLAHHMLYTGRIEKEVYKSKIRKILKSNEKELTARLYSVIGKTQTNIILDASFSDTYLAKSAQWKLRAALIRRRALKNIYLDSLFWIQTFLFEAYYIFKPLGLLVAVSSKSERDSTKLIRDVLPWLQRINRLNHGFARADLRDIILPEHQSSARKLCALYEADEKNQIRNHSKNWFRHRILMGRRRGWIICFPLEESSRFLLANSDLLITLGHGELSILRKTIQKQVVLKDIGDSKSPMFALASEIVKVLNGNFVQ